MDHSRSEKAFEILREAILSGALKPGQKLRSGEMQAMCGMSVSPMREALPKLVSAGLIEGEHNRGYRVTELTLAELDDLLGARLAIEGWALEQAMAAGDTAWEARILAAVHMLNSSPRFTPSAHRLHDSVWEGHHRAFHAALISACPNRTVLEICDTLSERAERYRRYSLTVEQSPRDITAEHAELTAAVLDRDVPAARQRLTEHFENTAAIIRKFLKKHEAPVGAAVD